MLAARGRPAARVRTDRLKDRVNGLHRHPSAAVRPRHLRRDRRSRASEDPPEPLPSDGGAPDAAGLAGNRGGPLQDEPRGFPQGRARGADRVRRAEAVAARAGRGVSQLRRLRSHRCGRRGRLEPAGEEAGREAPERPRLLPVGGAATLRAHRAAAVAGGHRHAGKSDRGGEAARPRPRVGEGAECGARQAFLRASGLSDRPLPRKGDGAEPDGDPLRQRAVRAAVELALRRAGADHRGGVDRGGRAGRLL